MMHMCTRLFQAAPAAAAASATPAMSKMTVLHKILLGELGFKSTLPLKACYVEESFGAGWEKELTEYTKKLSKADQDIVLRQVQRLRLTRYTTRELSQYLSVGGTTRVDAVAKEAQLKDARAYLQAKGEQEFRAMVEQEGALANWTPDMRAKFIAEVLNRK